MASNDLIDRSNVRATLVGRTASVEERHARAWAEAEDYITDMWCNRRSPYMTVVRLHGLVQELTGMDRT